MKWQYTVDVGRIEGEVVADDEDGAMHATTADALEKATDAVIAGTWEMRKVDDD